MAKESFWKKVQVCQLLKVVHGLGLASANVDRWSWKDGVSLEFSVNSAYNILEGEIEAECLRLFNFFWSIKVLPSTQVTT